MQRWRSTPPLLRIRHTTAHGNSYSLDNAVRSLHHGADLQAGTPVAWLIELDFGELPFSLRSPPFFFIYCKPLSIVPQTSHLTDTTLAILAGGAGSRMGKPKGFLKLGNQPILDYLLDHLAWPGPTILVTAPGREHPPGWRRFAREVSDPISGGGPLRGVLTALEHLETPLLLVSTIDMPGIHLTHAAWMLTELRNSPTTLGAVSRRIVEGRSQIEPFPLALRRAARPIVGRRLLEGKRSVNALLDEPGFVGIDSPDDWAPRVWTNLNIPADLSGFVP
jgi:molybdopterin-guanine dinucleotide biosynthesis protein A